MTTHIPAELSEDMACSRTVSRPLVSITYCAPRPPVNSSNADTGSPSAGLTVCVALSSDADSRRAALTSTATTPRHRRARRGHDRNQADTAGAEDDDGAPRLR